MRSPMTDLPGALGTSIRIFLANGGADGVWVVEKSNWTGKALMAPRTRYKELRARPDLDDPGVYLLIGPTESGVPSHRVYIGETTQDNEHQHPIPRPHRQRSRPDPRRQPLHRLRTRPVWQTRVHPPSPSWGCTHADAGGTPRFAGRRPVGGDGSRCVSNGRPEADTHAGVGALWYRRG
jgi:hypothetical protein